MQKILKGPKVNFEWKNRGAQYTSIQIFKAVWCEYFSSSKDVYIVKK